MTLVLAEWLSPDGLSREGRSLLAARAGWSDARLEIVDRSIAAYWSRTTMLARRSGYLAPPRLRNLAVVTDAEAVRPYCQILNTSSWLLYASDLDPENSNPELVCYLLVLGDRQAQVGEVTLAPVHLAPYWFERSPAECVSFAAAAAVAARPDGDALRAVAAALPWLRQLRHRTLKPPRAPAGHREIPGTGLLVPRAHESAPASLVEATRAAASRALGSFYERWRTPSDATRRALLDWLAGEAPPLLITTREQRIAWRPEAPQEVSALRDELADAGSAALEDIRRDLDVVAERTRAFLAAVVEPEALPRSDPGAAQSGYVYMHRERRLLAYNLHEPGIERLQGPAIPYAREMLGARAMHEWSHLAADAGWVPMSLGDDDWAGRRSRLAAAFAEVIARAPRAVRERTSRDPALLAGAGAGTGPVDVVLGRMPDFQANLVATRLLDFAERETYVRQNVRPLRPEVPPERLWTLLARALFEAQYLRFSASPDPLRLFLHSTWFADDLLGSGALQLADLKTLLAAVAELCAAYRIDESRFRWP